MTVRGTDEVLGLVPLWFSRLRPLERAFERHDCQHGVRTLFSIQRTVGILVLSQPWRAALSARITAMHARRSLSVSVCRVLAVRAGVRETTARMT